MRTISPLALTELDVHVWTLRTDVSDTLVARVEATLDSGERRRAARYVFDQARWSFVIARGALRCLLGRYLGVHPASIRFSYGPNGKPAIESKEEIEFSATHSGGMAAFAFTIGCRIGVDLERVRPFSHWQLIADRFFCLEEVADLRSLPPSEREDAFFRCWTRKEAYLKAIGEGLSAPLDGFRVALRPHEPASFVHLYGDRETARFWTLHDLRVASGFAAALAYRGRRRSLSIFHLTDLVELTARL